MIERTYTKKNHRRALTSDRWHVVHARWQGAESGKRPFQKAIVSEHDTEAAAEVAAKALRKSLETSLAKREAAECDWVAVCKPKYRSFATSRARKASPA